MYKIAIFGKNKLINELLESYLNTTYIDMEIYTYTPDKISSQRNKYDYVLLNNVCLSGDTTDYIKRGFRLVNNREDLILINSDYAYSTIDGYREIRKSDSLKDLLTSLSLPKRSIGDSIFSPKDILSKLPEATGVRESFLSLTKHQQKIVCYLISDSSYSEIEDVLNICTRTLKTHNTRIFKKMNVKSRTELQNLLAG